MDEITMFSTLRPPPPADPEQIRERARRRLGAAVTSASSPGQGQAVRRSRRPVLLAGAAAVAAASAAITVPAVIPGGAGPFVAPAWAVQRSPDDTIKVTIRSTLHDQAGLQRALRADGVPAYVRSLARCAWIPAGGLGQMREDSKALRYPFPGNHDSNFKVIIIHPAALPKGDTVVIAGARYRDGGLGIQVYLMHSSRPPVCGPLHLPTPISPHSRPSS